MSMEIMCDNKIIAEIVSDNYVLTEGVDKDDIPFGLFTKSNIESVQSVWDWFSTERVFPRERVDCKELLNMLGLDFYDEWAIVKKTGASQMTDPWWLRIEDDWTYENNTVRGIMERRCREQRNKLKNHSKNN